MAVYKKLRYDIDGNEVDNIANTLIYATPDDLEYDVDIGQIAYIDSLEDFVVFNGSVWKILESQEVAAPFTLTANKTTVDEGQSVVFELVAPYTEDGVTIAYTITGDGVTAADLGLSSLTGTLTIGSGVASLFCSISLDGATEGAESFTLTLAQNDSLGNPTGSLSQTVVINDVTTTVVSGEQIYVSPGSYTFTVPSGVVDISAVVIGGGAGGATGYYSNGSGGGGGGGGLAWMNGISCQPGDTFTVQVGSAGSRGSTSYNTPFEYVSSNSGSYLTFYPTMNNYNYPSNGGQSFLAKDSVVYIRGEGGNRPSTITSGGAGGAYYTNPSYGTSSGGSNGSNGNAGASGNSGVRPGGGGGAGGYGTGGGGGQGGSGLGDFYRSTGGYNYYKQASGGPGGGTNIYGQGGTGGGGTSAPNLVTSTNPLVINYNSGTKGGTGSSAIGSTAPNNGSGAGGGGGGGAGGRIRDQAIITSYGARFYYRWFLGQDGSTPLPGAVRIIWGQGRSYPSSAT